MPPAKCEEPPVPPSQPDVSPRDRRAVGVPAPLAEHRPGVVGGLERKHIHRRRIVAADPVPPADVKPFVDDHRPHAPARAGRWPRRELRDLAPRVGGHVIFEKVRRARRWRPAF
eukprot:1950882-Rhodomonas_salina.2